MQKVISIFFFSKSIFRYFLRAAAAASRKPFDLNFSVQIYLEFMNRLAYMSSAKFRYVRRGTGNYAIPLREERASGQCEHTKNEFLTRSQCLAR